MLVDSHVNLHHEKFAGEVDRIIADARAAGVSAMLTISDKISSSDAIRAIASRYECVWRSVGAHPHYASDHLDVTSQTLASLAVEEDVIGIGECGLDFHYEFSPREAQQRVFAAHIEAAQATGLPLIIHAREADDTMGSMLAAAMGKRPFAPLLHCYTGSLRLAEEVVGMGGYVSFSGIITFKNADAVRAVAARMPHDRIIIETDCPYLAPVPHRGRRCEPAHLVHVADKLAEILDRPRSEIDDMTTGNFFKLFKRARRPGENS
ncbi:MAG: TatD family hydrolase [Parvularculaceae bacterium]|nr:TatD family hydrolase [Parvularculaceae bacterium]